MPVPNRPMTAFQVDWPPQQLESHFQPPRTLRCFANRPRSLHALLANAVAKRPQAEALVCDNARLTYAQLNHRVGQLAAGWKHLGIQAGDRIALLLGNRMEFVVCLLAATRLGAITVPMSIREQTPGLQYMLEHSAAVMLVHEAELSAVLPASSEVPRLRWRVSIETCNGSLPWETMFLSDALEDVAAVQEDDTAVILYTSGTTGRPKGAMLSHLGMIHSCMHFQAGMDLGPGDVSIAAVPLSHVTGLVALVATMLHCAAKLVIMPAFKAPLFLQLAQREHMTHSLMVPAMYNLCLLQPEFNTTDLRHWRVGAYGGAPMPVASIEALSKQLPQLLLMNCYGATETTSPATIMPPGMTPLHNDTVGQAVVCGELKVVDEDGQALPAGSMGEIWIKGPMVVAGYWNNPEATAKEFVDGYWKSGDMGSIDDQGYVRILDRKKDMLNRGGYKIYSIEVENTLYQHPAVVECAIVSKPCSVLGERVHAFVSVREAVDAQALTAFCSSRLSREKVPESYTIVTDALPRNANGKLMKRHLREQLLQSLSAL
ncbi:MAG: class I adenylate-forming enzyme family protein [Limnohabitans sp.]